MEFDFKKIGGGWLIQTPDIHNLDINDCNVVTDLKPTDEQLGDMKFAWVVSQYVKSNAIVFCKNKQTLGIGAGQMSRIDAATFAAEKARDEGKDLEGSILASDAFFPFRDTVDLAAKFGVKAIVQPGGSKRDSESIEACNENGIAMVFTGRRHFKH